MKIELNKIYNQRAEEYLKLLPADFINLTITSPPYDSLRLYNSLFDLKLIAKLLLKKTAPGGVCVWVVADQTKNFSESGTSFRQALEFIKCGWCLYDTMIWEKTNNMPTGNRRYSDKFEYMFVFSKVKVATFNPLKEKTVYAGRVLNWKHNSPKTGKVWGNKSIAILEDKTLGNVWRIGIGQNHSTKDQIAFKHPAIFPEKLAADHIYSWSNEGDVVCDIFSGSATTAKMAYELNRSFIGCEIDPEYWRLGNERLAIYTNQLKIKTQN